VSAGGARRGRRDNGLDAAEYAVAGDVDPRVGEHLLDVLAAGGIAAYLQPSTDLNPVTRTTTVPSRPTDRLYVDRGHLATARDYLTQLSGEGPPPRDAAPNDPDVEAEWARIVAGYHRDAPADRPWPSAEDVTFGAILDPPADTSPGPTAPPRPDQTGTGSGVRHRPFTADTSAGPTDGRGSEGVPEDDSLLDGLDTFGTDLPDGPEDRYVPPPPPPLPRVSKFAVAGVLAVTLGFTLFLFPSLLPLDRGMSTMIGFIAILAGFVTLVWRLRPGDDEDDPDDGAVV
jgi:hypothetical protein